MLQCDGCGTQAFADCTCPAGHAANVGAHHPECSHADLDSLVTCPPGSGCCAQDHDHAAAANACPGGHEDVPCPDEASCRVWRAGVPDVLHPQFSPATGVPPCPGGHCHRDIPDCGVCRSLTITVLPGSTTITPVAG